MNKASFRGVILGRMNEVGIYTQGELARKTHIPTGTLNCNLRDPETMSLRNFSTLVAYLNLSGDDIKKALK